MRPRVLLADDHQLLLEAFKKLLEEECEIVGMVTDGRALLEAAPRLKPDVVVLDISMPLLNGLEAGRRLKQMMPGIKLIFLTVNEDPDLVAEAFRGEGRDTSSRARPVRSFFRPSTRSCEGGLM